jgi:DNA-binding NtrC family response regulator
MSSRILLVDDDQDFAVQTRMHLESAGYTVSVAESVAQAEGLLENEKPDLAVVDLMLENTDGGFVLSHHIKKKYPGLPVIMLSGVASETGIPFDAATDEEREWISVDVFLAKPVRFEKLDQEIRRLLEV